MLARIAQELFWLGRDLTRAEHTARMLDGAFHADVAGAPGRARIALSWDGCWRSIGAKPPLPGEDALEAGAERRVRGRSAGAEIARLLTLDTDSPASVVSCVARARERGRTLRDVISTEMWEALNSFYLPLGRYDLQAALRTGPYSVYQEVKERCALFWGLVDRTMLRDEGRAFLEAGGRIEEADMVLRMLRVAVPAGRARRRPRERGARAAARGRRLPGLPARRTATRPRSGRWSGSCCTTARTPARSRSSVAALRDALVGRPTRSRAPRRRCCGSERLIADLELQRRTPRGRRRACARCWSGYRKSSS